MALARYVIEVTTRMPDGDAEEAVRRAARLLGQNLAEASVTARLVQEWDLEEIESAEPSASWCGQYAEAVTKMAGEPRAHVGLFVQPAPGPFEGLARRRVSESANGRQWITDALRNGFSPCCDAGLVDWEGGRVRCLHCGSYWVAPPGPDSERAQVLLDRAIWEALPGETIGNFIARVNARAGIFDRHLPLIWDEHRTATAPDGAVYLIRDEPYVGDGDLGGSWWYILVRDASGLPFSRPEPGLDDKYGGSISLGTVMARAQAHARDFHTPEDFIRWQAPAPGPRLSDFSPSMCCAAPLTVHGRDRHATCDSCGAAHPCPEPEFRRP